MTRLSWLATAALAALAAACAGHESAQSETQSSMAASSMAAAPSTSESTATAEAAMSDQAPAAQPAPAPSTTSANYTDAQLRSFGAAAMEIDPISRALATATPEQRTAATAQIRAILQRNNLDEATYNAIAARASSDPAFAARIRTLHQGHG